MTCRFVVKSNSMEFVHVLSLDMIFLMFPDAVGQLLLAHGLQIPDNTALVHDNQRGLLDQILQIGLKIPYVEVIFCQPLAFSIDCC